MKRTTNTRVGLFLALATSIVGCGPASPIQSATGGDGGSGGDTSITGSGAGGTGASTGGVETGGSTAGSGGTTGSGGAGGSGGGGAGGGQSACPPVTLGTGTDSLFVVVDDKQVYWTTKDPGAPMRAPICGGVPATPMASGSAAGEYELLVDETYVYWASDGGDLYRAPKDGGAPELVTSAVGNGLGQTSTHIYWFDTWYDNGSHAAIRRAPKSGGPAETVLDPMPDTYPTAKILTDDTYLYWLSGTGASAVYRLPLSGGAAEWIGFGEGIPKWMAADATDLYLISDFSNTLWIQRVPKAGGDAVLVGTLPGSPQQIVVDDASLFVSVQAYLPNPSSKQGILKMPKAGGAYSWAVQGEIAPYGLAVDDLYLYYTHNAFNGTVRQIPKP